MVRIWLRRSMANDRLLVSHNLGEGSSVPATLPAQARLGRGSELGEPRGRLPKALPGGVEVDLGGGDGLVAQEVLHRVQLHAPLHEEGGVGVAELVGGEAPGVQARPKGGLPK